MASLLAELPASLAEAGDHAHIQLIDWELLSETAGIDAPPGNESEDKFTHWLTDLLETDAYGAFDGASQATNIPAFAELSSNSRLGEFRGLAPIASKQYASIHVGFSHPWAVFLKGAELPEGLEDLGDGVFGIGEGEEFEIDVDRANELDSLGRPTRLGERGDVIAVGPTKRAVQDWLEELPRLDSQAEYAEVVTALDDEGSVAGFIVRDDFINGSNRGATDARFTTVGIGFSKSGDRMAYTVAYYFESPDGAESAPDELRAAWQATDVAGTNLSELITVESTEVSGSLLVVKLTASSESSSLPAQLFGFWRVLDIAPLTHN